VSRTGIIGAIALAVALAAALAYAFWPRPIPVDLAVIARGDVAVTVDEEGRTRVREVFVISAPIAGRLRRIEAAFGDRIVAGQTVASILPNEPAFLDARSRAQAEAAVKAAEAASALAQADVERARAELEFAHSEYARAQALIRSDTIAQRALDQAQLLMRTREAALGTAQAALTMRRFELETARAALILPTTEGDDGAGCCVVIRAPIDGVVLGVLQESAGVVLAGTPLIEVGDPRDLEIVVDVLSADTVRIVAGAVVAIDDWGGPASLTGRVQRIEPFGFTKVSALGVEEQLST